jgi:hypothetical protein
MLYQLLKDFAGPVATVIAAATAAVFVRRQAKTADRQAETALDQLRYNLFERRYAIYQDVKDLIGLLANEAPAENFNVWRVAPHFVVIDEARFFFSDAVSDWLAVLKKECQALMVAQASGLSRDPMDVAKKTAHLLERLEEMPAVFASELGFRQLTGPGTTGRS